jgi:hypothetical protein
LRRSMETGMSSNPKLCVKKMSVESVKPEKRLGMGREIRTRSVPSSSQIRRGMPRESMSRTATQLLARKGHRSRHRSLVSRTLHLMRMHLWHPLSIIEGQGRAATGNPLSLESERVNGFSRYCRLLYISGVTWGCILTRRRSF